MELSPRDVTMPTMDQWRLMIQQADVLVKSRFLPQSIQTAEQAVAVILTGRELGIPTMGALRNIVIIQGRPTIQAGLMAALVYRDHGDAALEVVESTPQLCRVRYRRRGWAEAREYVFSLDDAKRADLVGKATWKQYPQAMLRARAISAVCTMAFQDSILGMYTPEELDAEVEVDASGEVIAKALPPPSATRPALGSGDRGSRPEPPPTTATNGAAGAHPTAGAPSETAATAHGTTGRGARRDPSAVVPPAAAADEAATSEPPPTTFRQDFGEGTAAERGARFLAECDLQLSMPLHEIKRALGMDVKAFMEQERQAGRAAALEDVYAHLERIVYDRQAAEQAAPVSEAVAVLESDLAATPTA